jgi:hypothetical protein
MKLFSSPFLSSVSVLLAVRGYRPRSRRGKALLPLLLVLIVLGAIGGYWGFRFVQKAKVGLAYGDSEAFLGSYLAVYTKQTARLPHDIGGLSWRVEMLRGDGNPQDEALFKRFRLDEPWDGPHNKLLIERIPWWLQDPEGKKGFTCYRGVRGKDCAFDDGKQVKPPASGKPNLVAVVVTEESCPWTKPVDAPVADVENGRCLRWFKADGYHSRAGPHDDAYTDMIPAAGGHIGLLRSKLPVNRGLLFTDSSK